MNYREMTKSELADELEALDATVNYFVFDRNGVELGNAPSLEAIKRVKVEFAVQGRNPDPKVAGHVGSALSSSIEFRN